MMDPRYGRVREPVIKLINFLRSLEYTPYSALSSELGLYKMKETLGQGVFASETVFGFYLPTYIPESLISIRATSPEMQIHTAPNMISYMNGINSLVEYGLTS